MKFFTLALILLAGLWALMSIRPEAQSRPNQVVALAPSYCENMRALGLEKLLVGVSNHCEGDVYKDIQKIGSFLEPNFEAIMALHPSLVLAVPHPMAKNILDMLKEHVEIFAQQPDSLADIYAINMALAKKFGVEEKGQQIEADIKKALADSHNNLGLTFLFAVSASPLVVAGKNTFASEILSSMGLMNLAQSEIPWPIWPLESLLKNPPDILIIESPESLPYKNLLKSLGMPQLPMLVPTQPLFQSPSPKIIEDINYMKELFTSNNHE